MISYIYIYKQLSIKTLLTFSDCIYIYIQSEKVSNVLMDGCFSDKEKESLSVFQDRLSIATLAVDGRALRRRSSHSIMIAIMTARASIVVEIFLGDLIPLPGDTLWPATLPDLSLCYYFNWWMLKGWRVSDINSFSSSTFSSPVG